MARVKDIIQEHYDTGKKVLPKQLAVRGIKWNKKESLSLNEELDLPTTVTFDIDEDEFRILENVGLEDTVNSWLYDTFSFDFINYKSLKFIY